MNPPPLLHCTKYKRALSPEEEYPLLDLKRMRLDEPLYKPIPNPTKRRNQTNNAIPTTFKRAKVDEIDAKQQQQRLEDGPVGSLDVEFRVSEGLASMLDLLGKRGIGIPSFGNGNVNGNCLCSGDMQVVLRSSAQDGRLPVDDDGNNDDAMDTTEI